jgi:hypothetical protein
LAHTSSVPVADANASVQFHTRESYAMKEEQCHASYAKFRKTRDSRKAVQYWEEMVAMWDMVPVPEDVLSIPKVVQQVS